MLDGEADGRVDGVDGPGGAGGDRGVEAMAVMWVSLWLDSGPWSVCVARNCSTRNGPWSSYTSRTCPHSPVINAAPPERADAARNRRRVLDGGGGAVRAPTRECVTMEAVAAEAGVGKGTLFRRFGDRAGLARAVISEHEIELQEQLIRGAPPLGPGAPRAGAPDRVRRAPTSQFLERHARLMARGRGLARWLPERAVYALLPHARRAAAARGRPAATRADYLADVLMAPLAATDVPLPPRRPAALAARS